MLVYFFFYFRMYFNMEGIQWRTFEEGVDSFFTV